MREKMIGIFGRLGNELTNFGKTPETEEAIGRAVADNGWFDRAGIVRAVEAIRTGMLDRQELGRWLAAYRGLPVSRPRDVGVIMAGNIPLVGFFDMLCVLAAGHTCLYKPSSKDRALVECVVAMLRRVWPEAPVYLYIGQPLDALIATGSDNTRRLLRDRWRGIPTLLRGSRASAAVLTGDETAGEIDSLASDMFAYCGLGCRNVSHLLLPSGYDVEALAAALAHRVPANGKYRNNYRQRSAVLRMQGARFIDGGGFLLREDDGFPAAVAEITYLFYDTRQDAFDLLSAREGELQCVVGRALDHPRAVGFGRSQTPALNDYPDGVDVMGFLERI